jgi:hypothetical protein
VYSLLSALSTLPRRRLSKTENGPAGWAFIGFLSRDSLNSIMDITAEDLLPLVTKLSRDERLRLSRLAILLGGGDAATDDAAIYRAAPSGPDEFIQVADSDPLEWDSAGWDEVP